MATTASPPVAAPPPLTTRGRLSILVVAFLGWMFAGMLMALSPLAARSAVVDLLFEPDEGLVGRWFADLTAAFLFGGAVGGLLFGWVGDRWGRKIGMTASILCFSLVTGLSSWASSLEILLLLRFIACLGVGGMWPNGIAIVSEAWTDVSRPMLAGVIGTAANVGQVLFALLTWWWLPITPDTWRMVMLYMAAPAVLGVIAWVWVPESPRWLLERQGPQGPRQPVREVFRPPLLSVTILGIVLGTVPLLGGWGSGNWVVPWSDQVASQVAKQSAQRRPPSATENAPAPVIQAETDPNLKTLTALARSTGGSISSLLGGWVAGFFGRRRSYFLISLGSLAVSAYIFRLLTPPLPGEPGVTDWLWSLAGKGSVAWSEVNGFNFWTFVLGCVSGLFFGWLPLCLPEMFPAAVRSTGAGVTFNFGRIASGLGLLATGWLMRSVFQGDYARVGAMTSLIYAVGLVAIWFLPKSEKQALE